MFCHSGDDSITGQGLVELFNYLNTLKRGTKLETLVCHLHHIHDDRILLWRMGDLVIHRYNGPFQVREMYEASKLLWTWRRPREERSTLEEWDFPV